MSVQRFFQRGRYSRNSPKIYLFHNFTSSDSHTKPSNPSNHYHCHNHRYSQYVHFRNFLSPSKPQLVIPHSVSFCCRSFSTRDSPNGDIANTELFISENVSASVEESILPVRALISLLDGFHDFTGIPWWIVIASSTVAMRLTLFPFVVLQLHKLNRIGELLPKCEALLSTPLVFLYLMLIWELKN